MTDEPVPQKTDLVIKEGDWLTFAPNLSHAPNRYSLLLFAYLEDYSMVTAQRAFTVVVLPCEAQLISVGAQLSLTDIEREWSADAFLYNIENTIAAYD